MVYDIALWVALVLLGVGAVHRIDAWFLSEVGTGERGIPVSRRLAAATIGGIRTVFGPRILSVLRVVLIDVLFQGRILRDRKDPLAWVMHVCIFWGFLLLLLFHALGSVFARAVDPHYLPTLNPFLFLRNLFGAFLILGLVLAVVRRVVRRHQLRTTTSDVVVIVVLGCIALSGVLLESLKITSHREFAVMVTDYTGGLNAAETQALRTFWVSEYGLVSPVPAPSHDPTVLAQGRELHGTYCAACHSRPQSAFVSYAASRAIVPVAARLDGSGGVTVLWYVHVLACCVGLAYLAFSKMFHIVSTPVSLLVADAGQPTLAPEGALTRQALELDGCRHGGACHDACPVRQRRLARIDGLQTFDSMLAYLSTKTSADLGSRPVSD